MPTQAINRETVSSEALRILKSLKENGKHGRSNKLADVKATHEPSVSLEFDSYFFFLRKFHYIGMDREAQLKLTDQGEAVVGGDYLEKFTTEVEDFFSDQIAAADDLLGGDATTGGAAASDDDDEGGSTFAASPPPPPPPDHADLLVDEPVAPPVEEAPHAFGDEPFASSSVPPSVAPSVLYQPVPLVTSRVEVPDLRRDPPPPPPPPVALPPPVQITAPLPPVPPMPSVSPPLPPAPVARPSVAVPSSVVATPVDSDARYAKFDTLGSGPLGTVFKGRHNALGTEVCVKELKDIFGYFSFLQRGEVLKRLKRELCAQAAVRHPGVVQILDQNADGARPYFVMELARGSLKERLDAAGGKGLPVATVIRHFLQLSYGLRAAHATGLTHHNIKPENVLIDGFGNAKLGDFGLSRVTEVDQTKGMPQVFVGTGGMAYLAPELIGRSKDAGPSADVYSLGILLYEMLTGQLPGRRSPLPSEVNGEIPSKLDPIFDKMTQDKREARYPDFESMLADFYGAFSDGEYLGRGDLVLWSDPTKL